MSKRYETVIGQLTLSEARQRARRAIESGRNLYWVQIYNEIAEQVSEEQNPYKKYEQAARESRLG